MASSPSSTGSFFRHQRRLRAASSRGSKSSSSPLLGALITFLVASVVLSSPYLALGDEGEQPSPPTNIDNTRRAPPGADFNISTQSKAPASSNVVTSFADDMDDASVEQLESAACKEQREELER